MFLTLALAVAVQPTNHLSAKLPAKVAAQSAAKFHAINHLPLPNPSGTKFDFIALGDNRPVMAGLPATSTFRAILKDVAQINPDFVISSGDLLFGKSESLALYAKEIDEIQDLINQLPVPFFNAPGNHEISERPELYKEYTKRFGATYGSFDYRGWRFVAVSTEEVGSSPGVAQSELPWLKEVLSGPMPKIVFHHHPIYPRNLDEEGAGVTNHDEVEALYQAGNVKYAFQGHDHVFNHQTHGGIEYYISGGAGAPLDAAPQDGGFFHFLIVHVDGEKVQVDPIPAYAIQTTPTASGEVVGNYSDFPIHFGALKVRTTYKPKTVAAQSGKKKLKPVPAMLIKVTKVDGGYLSTVDVTAAPHLGTIVDLK